MRFQLKDTFLKTISLVDHSARMGAIFMLLIIIFSVVLETVGLGLFFPFIKLLIQPDQIDELRQHLDFLTFFADADSNTLLIVLSIFILVLFVLKNIFLLLIYYVQAKFTLDNVRLLSTRLYRVYLCGPYAMHLSRNSADLIQNIHAAASSSLIGSFMGFLTLFSELLMMIAIVILLLFIDPMTTLAAGSFLGGSVWLIYSLLRLRVQYWGERTLKVEKAILKSLQQGLHSIKEIKVLGREDSVLNDYKMPLDEYIKLTTIKTVMTQAPRLWIETITICTVMAIILYALVAGESAVSILPMLAVFAGGALRLIPSMNRIVVAFNRIHDSQYSVDVIYNDINLKQPADIGTQNANSSTIDFNRNIVLDKVSYKYETGNHAAVDAVSLKLEKGQSLGIVGASGAGKSTMADLLLGLLEPTSGRILVDDKDITANLRGWQRHLGYVPQTIYLLDDSLRRNIALGVPDDEIDEEQILRAIRLAQIEDFIATLPQGLDTNVHEHGVRLSGGQRQRVGIARALYHHPSMIVFDEATSALDNHTELEVNRAIESLSGKLTVIIIAHRLSTVRKCDKIVFLKDGRVDGLGTFESLSNDNDSFRSLVTLSQV